DELLRALDHRQQYLDELDCRRTDRYNPDCREDAKDEREHHLDAGFGGRFLCALPTFGPERFRVDTQGLCDARAELVRLDEHRDERLQIVDAGARGKIPKRFWPCLACAKLEVDEPQLVGQ